MLSTIPSYLSTVVNNGPTPLSTVQKCKQPISVGVQKMFKKFIWWGPQEDILKTESRHRKNRQSFRQKFRESSSDLLFGGSQCRAKITDFDARRCGRQQSPDLPPPFSTPPSPIRMAYFLEAPLRNIRTSKGCIKNYERNRRLFQGNFPLTRSLTCAKLSSQIPPAASDCHTLQAVVPRPRASFIFAITSRRNLARTEMVSYTLS